MGTCTTWIFVHVLRSRLRAPNRQDCAVHGESIGGLTRPEGYCCRARRWRRQAGPRSQVTPGIQSKFLTAREREHIGRTDADDQVRGCRRPAPARHWWQWPWLARGRTTTLNLLAGRTTAGTCSAAGRGRPWARSPRSPARVWTEAGSGALLGAATAPVGAPGRALVPQEARPSAAQASPAAPAHLRPERTSWSWNAGTMVGSLTLSPVFMPGKGRHLRCGSECLLDLTSWWNQDDKGKEPAGAGQPKVLRGEAQLAIHVRRRRALTSE